MPYKVNVTKQTEVHMKLRYELKSLTCDKLKNIHKFRNNHNKLPSSFSVHVGLE